MATLIYTSNMSLDGFTEDSRGGFSWAPPDDEVFVAITERMASAGTYLYGRRMYETMAVWETDPTLAERSDLTARFAEVWQAADKVVHSSTLTTTSTARTRLVDHVDAGAVEDLKSSADGYVLVGGPHLAAQALEAGLVDEIELFVWPVVLGGRNPALPAGWSAELDLLEHQRFPSGAVRLHYRVR
ncbi:riboflavin biosynthesis protein RibD C-terminal domain protein [Aeromicrobium marinum DSM 15272]|uniref:Riboflavin biosynthesis protein RibD C-terminal domain protein n=1 Tax=Aeromicrobium marinum DSM 15272 TaxID=585531 RepID=E2SAT2_9ACTN|nr:dihydrofolate reductase family protein [Aeromicrobium marinum]EFQ83478.1 riboflavin biosynthesis protein RibD C-terminal domain protein [Aeromicrobium marinum DSM 15272]